MRQRESGRWWDKNKSHPILAHLFMRTVVLASADRDHALCRHLWSRLAPSSNYSSSQAGCHHQCDMRNTKSALLQGGPVKLSCPMVTLESTTASLFFLDPWQQEKEGHLVVASLVVGGTPCRYGSPVAQKDSMWECWLAERWFGFWWRPHIPAGLLDVLHIAGGAGCILMSCCATPINDCEE